VDELTVGTICGGSDATSGLTANPAMGVAFDLLVADGATTIFEETGELIGMEHLMAARATTSRSARRSEAHRRQGRGVLRTLGYASFAPATRTAASRPSRRNRSARTRSRASRRSTASSSPASSRRSPASICSTWCPTAKCASASQHQRQRGDRRAHRLRLARHPVLDRARVGGRLGHRAGDQGLRQSGHYRGCSETWTSTPAASSKDARRSDDVGREIYDLVARVGKGAATRSEELGHQEFILTYKSFEPLGPSCLPA
jgi:altronate hydrolase